MLKLENGRLFAQVNIQNKTLLAALDTGASASFIIEHRARELDNWPELKKQSVRVKQADGTFIDASQYLMVTIGLGTEQVHMPITIMSSIQEEVILGMDFMFGINVTIQCGGFHLRLEGEDALNTDYPGIQARDTPEQPEYVQFLAATIPEEPSTSPTQSQRRASITDQEAIDDKASGELAAIKSTDWVIGPPEWRIRTPNNTLPATLRNRLVKKVQQHPKKDLKYLVEVEGSTFRVHINKRGKLTLHLLHGGRKEGEL